MYEFETYWTTNTVHYKLILRLVNHISNPSIIVLCLYVRDNIINHKINTDINSHDTYINIFMVIQT